MAMFSRAGTGLLLAVGLVLAVLMISLLTPEGVWPDLLASSEAAEVAVFFPNRDDWLDFRAGIETCARRGLVQNVRVGEDVVTVETPERRPVRFTWHSVRGLLEAKDQVRRLRALEPPPVAVIGSDNTVLTVGLAEALAEVQTERRRKPAPVLLVPQATSVLARHTDGRGGEVPLLEIHRGRTFRFCFDNQRQADLAIGQLMAQDGRPAGRAVILVDPNDPYSVDLGACFRRVIVSAAPKAEVETINPKPRNGFGLNGPGETPGPADYRLAADLWTAAVEADRAGHGPTWLVLPLQYQPTRKMLRALQNSVREDGPLRVVCGDAIGGTTLAEFVGLSFPVLCTSAGLVPEAAASPGSNPIAGGLIPAEVVSALVRGLDDSAGGDLAPALASLDLAAHDPAALGRSLAFQPSGERRGDDLGQVLAIEPGHEEVLASWRDPEGRWRSAVVPEPIAPLAAAP